MIVTKLAARRTGLGRTTRVLIVSERDAQFSQLRLVSRSSIRAFSAESSTDKKKDEDKKDGDAASASSSSFKFDDLKSKLKDANIKSRLEGVVSSTKERLFAKDETSWADALRAVFGLKPEDAKKDAPSVKRSASSEKAQDAAASADAKAQMTPEEEAKKFMEDQHKAQSGPSPFEIKIQELVGEIQRLEKEREEAQAASDMAKFKELNKKTREVRKELEGIQARMNTTSVVVVEERKGAWESFSETLRDTPLLKGIFGLGETKAAQKITSAAEDAREAWETSQHPLVYRVQSVWDSMFAETEMGEAIREFRKIDRDFTMEGFVQEMEEEVIPVVLTAFLRGDVTTLQQHLSEGAFAAVKAAVEQRVQAGRKMDPNILNIQHTQVIAAKVVEKFGPIAVLQFMAQQVDVLYDNAGNIAEGKDDQVAAVFYAFVMTREKSEEDESLRWVVSEFAIVGTVPWI